MKNIFIHLGMYRQVRLGSHKSHIMFPYLYFWFKDHYYQRSYENYKQTNWDYIDTREFIRDNIDMQNAILANPPDVVALSLYAWNAERLLENARWIKERFPECLIVAGGPDAVAKLYYFHDFPHVDIVVRGPGTEIFRLLLDAVIEDKDVYSVPGIAYLKDDIVTFTELLPRKEDPLIYNYVQNFRSEVVEWLDNAEKEYDEIVFLTTFLQGCPYSCSFCEQGLDLWTKITKRPIEYVFAELDLLSNYKNIQFEFIDANFGITADYEKIIDYIVDIKQNKNKNFYLLRPSYAKNDVDRVFRIHDKMLQYNLAGRHESLGYLALQDTNEDILELNGRPVSKEFQKIDKFKELIKKHGGGSKHIDADILVILGMPGQTTDSMIQMLVDLFNADIMSGTSTPNLYIVVENTRLTDDPNSPWYRAQKLHVKSISTSSWIDRDNDDLIQNYLIEAESFTPRDLASWYYFYILSTWAGGMLRWFDTITAYLQNYHNIKGEDFIRGFLYHFRPEHVNLLPPEIQKDIVALNDWFNGKKKYYTRHDDRITEGTLTMYKASQFRFISNYEEFEQIAIKTGLELIGHPDQMFLDIMNWVRLKTLHATDGAGARKTISYNYDDIAEMKSDVYYLSEFTFDWYFKNNHELYEQINNDSRILYIPDLTVKEISPDNQKPLTQAEISDKISLSRQNL